MFSFLFGSISDLIYSEPYSFYRTNRPEPQGSAGTTGIAYDGQSAAAVAAAASSSSLHHGIGNKLGNGQSRLQSHYPGVTLRRDPIGAAGTAAASAVAFDPHYAHLTPIDRRESSASATSSLGSYESGSTLTSDIGDTPMMTRLRKSLEQKEEFLLRGVTQPQDVPANLNKQQINQAQLTSTNQINQDAIPDKCKFIDV